MRKVLFLLLSLLPLLSIAIAEEWKTISPLSHCKKFKIEYMFDGVYKIRYKETRNSNYKLYPKTLKNLNNLSLLSNELMAISQGYCPSKNVFSSNPDGIYTCSPEKISSEPFDKNYMSLLLNMIETIDKFESNCNDVIPLIKLQNEIAQLDQKKLLHFKKSRNILKLFTNSKSDKLIDHFNDCGGSQNVNQFIKNVILLEAKDACMFPSPPGLITFDQAEEIAQKVSEKYKEVSAEKYNIAQSDLGGKPNRNELIQVGLIELALIENDLTKDTLVSFSNAAFNTQVRSIFGDDFPSEKFVSNLNVVKKLKKIKSSKSMDYVSYILSPNAPLEIIDKGLPSLINSSFIEMLPNEMSQLEKKNYIKESILPIVKEEYESCISQAKKRIKFGFKGDDLELIMHRKKIENAYCSKNKKACSMLGCKKIKNFLTLRSDITDMNKIQACLFKGIANSIRPLLKKIITVKKDSFKNDFDLSTNTVNSLSETAFNDLYSCTDKKVKEISNKNYEEGFTHNIEALYHITTKEYTKVLSECSKNSEKELTAFFAKMMIINLEAVKKMFPSKVTKILHNKEVNVSTDIFAMKIAKKALNSCLMYQKKKVTIMKSSSIMCKPIIEMEAAKKLVASSLRLGMDEAKVPKQKITKIINKYLKCSSKAIEKANESYFNPKSKNPIVSIEDSNQYLNLNHSFFNCLPPAIESTSQAATFATLTEMEKEILPQLDDKDFFYKLKPEISKKVRGCFTNKIKNIKSWNSFLKFHDQDGVTKLKEKCTEKATEFALSTITVNETNKKLSMLRDLNLTAFTMKNISSLLKKSYQLKSKPATNDLKVVTEAYRSFPKKEDGSEVSDFVKDYTQKVQLNVLSDIRINILEELLKNSSPRYDFSDLEKSITPTCLNKLYEFNKENIKHITELIEKNTPANPEEKKDLKKYFIDVLQKGLIRSKESNRYEAFINNLNKICSRPEDFKDIKDLTMTGIADDIILGQLGERIRTYFINTAESQCYLELENEKISLKEKSKKELCSRTNSKDGPHEKFMAGLRKEVLTKSKWHFLNFISKRQRKSIKMIQEKLSQSHIDRLFYTNPGVLKDIFDHFDLIVSNDPKELEKVTIKAVNRLFEDKSISQFASDFVELQLVSAIGIKGLPIAKKEAEHRLSNLKFYENPFIGDIAIRTESELHKRWNFEGVAHYLNWNNLPDYKRKELINGLISSNIEPVINSNITDKRRIRREESYVKKVESHVKTFGAFKNPEYNSYPDQKTLSFSEKLAYDVKKSITEAVTESIEQSLRNTVKDFMKRK